MIFGRRLLLFFFLFLSVVSYSQKHNYNWYFGRNAAIRFDGAPPFPTVEFDNKMQTRASVSVSDSATGELLFYSDGRKVWDKNHQVMPNGDNITTAPVQGAIAVPNPANKNQYYIFTVEINRMLEYTLIDMSLNGGLGDVISKNTPIATNTAQTLTAVKHQFENAYWLITHSNQNPAQNIFRAFKVSATGIATTPIESQIGVKGNAFGDLVSSHDGKKLALTLYDKDDAIAQVFDFDKHCGTINNVVSLHKENHWDYAYGAAFSPDDKMLYIAYSYLESQLVQYFGTTFSNWDVVAYSDNNFNDLLIGPDNKLYINTHFNNIPSNDIDVLHNPNGLGFAADYQQDFINVGTGRNGNFEFPNFITDKSTPKPTSGSHGLSITYTNVCIGDSTRFTLSGNANPPDSVKWQFLDTLSSDTVSYLVNPAHKFSKKGEYWVIVNYYRCGLELIMAQRIKIIDAAAVSLGPDTTICHNDSIMLKSDAIGMTHVWNTGETTETITAKQSGWYWVTVTSPTCSATDSIYLTELPPILIELGSGYTVCEHDTDDLVKLDAGKGYSKYKWTPTQDTTQWIIVKQAGDYYVVVEDYRGCKGDDGSKVLRLCSFDFHIPNAFTPNNDGLNDVFKATALDIYKLNFEIYNTWGERVFKTNNSQQGWDGTYKGKPCPEGVYLYRISFNGFSNKQLKTYNFKGNVSLLR
jgi:gliding motility-associated-like protein